jgi:hypothetical protein
MRYKFEGVYDELIIKSVKTTCDDLFSIKSIIKRETRNACNTNPITFCLAIFATILSITGVIQVLQSSDIIKPINSF